MNTDETRFFPEAREISPGAEGVISIPAVGNAWLDTRVLPAPKALSHFQPWCRSARREKSPGAEGVISMPVWGNAPGFDLSQDPRALKARFRAREG
jgi:hypothetical protein